MAQASETATKVASAAANVVQTVGGPLVERGVALAQAGVAAVQSGALWDAAETVNTLASTRAELSLGLAVAEVGFASRGSSTVLAKALVALNGASMAVWAYRGLAKPAEWWSSNVGLALKGADVEAAAALPLYSMLATGAGGVVAGLVGPEKHLLAVVSLAAQKLALAAFLVQLSTNAVTAKAAAKAADLLRHQARTGFVLLAYALMVWWRGTGRAPAPRYISELETRLVERIDSLASATRDVVGRLENMADAAPMSSHTPIKYNGGGES